jgi:hypothetical protein
MVGARAPLPTRAVLTSFLRDISEELKGVEGPSRRLLAESPPMPDGPKDEKDKHDIHDFFGKIFGKDWAKWVPKDWSAKGELAGRHTNAPSPSSA